MVNTIIIKFLYDINSQRDGSSSKNNNQNIFQNKIKVFNFQTFINEPKNVINYFH